ncbi:DUF418 domain-containing protein [Alkalicoccus saliphilus]|uniref:DUF418 domain-containing protein n=1 Tax=Alkalicoccus saliphilus TaxID=200989 RepID=A0A2T4U4C1_9BACI|nr:DUF418 domain-containing protein [Alkalicoccus saliphilus]PTL38260.1 hypothetical protein C6Y45_12095 [Alkalicoccus saliphilus]
MKTANDLRQGKRIEVLDELRGFTLLGIFLINIPYLADVMSDSQPALKIFLTILVEDSARPLFAVMFGISMVLIYDRTLEKNQNPYPLLLRRLLILGFAGAVHGTMIWSGDILFKFAMAGFILLLFMRLPSLWLFISGLAFWLIYTVGMDIFNHYSPYVLDISVFLKDSLPAAANFPGYEYVLIEAEAMSLHLGFFLLGMYFYRVNILALTASHRNKLWVASAVLFTIGTAGKTALFYEINSPAVNGLETFYPFILTLSVLFGVLLWGTTQNSASSLLLPFKPIGRMTFTNYLIQSLVFVTLFTTGRSIFVEIGIWNEPSYFFALSIGMLLFALQMVFSWLWMKKFYFGPFEWLWRIGTHGKIVPIQRKPYE